MGNEWQPIKTAPQDELEDVLVYCADTREMFVAFPVGSGVWQFANTREGGAIGCEPTHWMPLPAPPEEAR